MNLLGREISLINKSALVFIFSLFFGCSPVYKNFYSYEPMKTDSKRTCAMGCNVAKQSCTFNMQQSYQLCLTSAKIDYQSCKNSEQWGYNSKGKYECLYNCFCYESSCDKPDLDLCEDQYFQCYTACGGKGTKTTRCVENCEQENAQTAPLVK